MDREFIVGKNELPKVKKREITEEERNKRAMEALVLLTLLFILLLIAAQNSFRGERGPRRPSNSLAGRSPTLRSIEPAGHPAHQAESAAQAFFQVRSTGWVAPPGRVPRPLAVSPEAIAETMLVTHFSAL